MLTVVLGTINSGKSAIAEKIAVNSVDNCGLYYIATMIPFGRDGDERIEKHRRLRAGKGFETIECPVDVDGKDILSRVSDGVCLLECATNLAGNVMHDLRFANEDIDSQVQIILEKIDRLAKAARELIVVSNEFALEDESYDDDTRHYVKVVHKMNMELEKRADIMTKRECPSYLSEA